MIIEITSEAEQYIIENGKEVFIKVDTNAVRCCGVATLMPKISLRKPKDLTSYILKEINNINVFVDKRFDDSSIISISLSKFLKFKGLYVSYTESSK
ncbi:MAG: CC/Se motif family (seleno)protein [Tissierellaceae bacterium]|nr:CC/Se motif family (seleno)protein [Tissierellaceae bacterium]